MSEHDQHNGWTTFELRRLKKLYPELRGKELRAAFPRHSLQSIRQTARMIGAARKHNDWSAICAAHNPRIILAAPVVHEVRE